MAFRVWHSQDEYITLETFREVETYTRMMLIIHGIVPIIEETE